MSKFYCPNCRVESKLISKDLHHIPLDGWEEEFESLKNALQHAGSKSDHDFKEIFEILEALGYSLRNEKRAEVLKIECPFCNYEHKFE